MFVSTKHKSSDYELLSRPLCRAERFRLETERYRFGLETNLGLGELDAEKTPRPWAGGVFDSQAHGLSAKNNARTAIVACRADGLGCGQPRFFSSHLDAFVRQLVDRPTLWRKLRPDAGGAHSGKGSVEPVETRKEGPPA